jgi:hypothetical protein
MAKLRKGLVHKNPLPERAKDLCAWSGKIRWLSHKDALLQQTKIGGSGSVYYCTHCHNWHLTRKEL